MRMSESEKIINFCCLLRSHTSVVGGRRLEIIENKVMVIHLYPRPSYIAI